MPTKFATKTEFNEACDEIKEVKALVFELKDNHLKHLQSDMDCIKGKLQILMPFIYAILGVSVLAGLATLYERLYG